MKNKIACLVLVIVLSIGLEGALAQKPQKIFIIDLDYNHNKVQILGTQSAIGYYPDRKVQPDSGYTFVMKGYNDSYSFIFPDPSIMFTDASGENQTIYGGIVRLNKTSFSLVVPYMPNANSIIILDKDNKELVKYEIKREKEDITYEKIFDSNVMQLILILIIAIIILFLLIRKKRKGSKLISFL